MSPRSHALPPRAVRPLALAVLLIIAATRPGVDRLDRFLATWTWNVPSEWNAVAATAIRGGVVDDEIGGQPAPWRHADIVPVADTRVAIVSVSDMRRTRVAILQPGYGVRGRFERETIAPETVTDEARGYKPISNVWPFDVHGDRLETLLASTSLVSEAPNRGLFAYLSIGPTDNEILFVIDLQWGPGPTWGLLARSDLNGDGFDDFVVYDCGRRERAPLATFIWDERGHRYAPQVGPHAQGLLRFWSTSADHRTVVSQQSPLDATMRALIDETGGLPPGVSR